MAHGKRGRPTSGGDHLVTALDRTLSQQQVLWSVPLCLTVHYLEEALGARKVA